MLPEVDLPTPMASTDGWSARLEARIGKWPFCLLLALIVQLGSFVLYPWNPNQDMTKLIRYRTLTQLSENPFTTEPLLEPTVRHRILLPLLAWIFHLHGPAYTALIFVGNYLFIVSAARLLRQSLPPSMTVLSTMLLGTTLAVITSQNWLTVQDCFAYAALVCCLLLRQRKWSIAPLLFLGMLADERCVTGVPLLLLWCRAIDTPGDSQRDQGKRLLYAMLAFAGFVAVYLTLHKLMTRPGEILFAGFNNQTDFISNTLQGNVFMRYLPYVPAGLWFSLRAAWLLPLFLTFYFREKTGLVGWFIAGSATISVPAVLVNDISRVASLAFLSVLMAIILLYRARPALTWSLVKIALITNLLSPQFQIHTPHLSLIVPFPFVLMPLNP